MIVALSISTSLVGVWGSSQAHALTTFGAARPLNTFAATDGGFADLEASAASTGGGGWITVWSSTNDFGGTLSPGPRFVLFSRSADDGATWTTPEALPLTTTNAVVGSDRAGVVVVAGTWWFEDASVDDVEIVRSDDAGATWSSVGTFAVPDKPFNSAPVLATDYAGTWVLAWSSGNTVYGSDGDIFFVRSDDNGLTWSSVAALNADAAVDMADDTFVTIATDQAGTWLAAWGGREQIYVATSVDNGATWGPPVLGPQGIGGTWNDAGLDVATNGTGKWIIAWSEENPLVGDNPTVRVSASIDDGASWSAPGVIDELTISGIISTRIAYSGNSVWDIYGTGPVVSLARTIGQEGDAVHWRSFDDGASWTRASALTRVAGWDTGLTPNYDSDWDSAIEVASDGSGRWLAVWDTTFDFEADFGTGNGIGHDREVLLAIGRERCPGIPVADCTTSTSPTGAKISLKVVDGGRTKLSWSMGKGTATAPNDVGDPIGGDADYAFCVWDYVAGSPLLVLEASAEAQALGRFAEPCWTVKAAGVAYKDASRRNGPVQKLSVKSGTEGHSTAKLSAGGPTLLVPRLPFAQSPEVAIQLINTENGHCWESRFATSSANSSSRFQAR